MRPIRDAVVPLALLGVAYCLGWQAITIAFMVVGYAHFMLGYAYRVRAGRESTLYLIAVPASVLGLSWAYFSLGGSIVPVLILAPLIFAGHFAIDEFFLHNEVLVGMRWASIMLFLGIDFFLSLGLVLPVYSTYTFSGALVLLVVFGGIVRFQKNITHTERYLAFIAALLCLVSVLGSIELVIGVVVLLHCINWYVRGYERAKEKHGLHTYWRDVTLTLGLSCVVFALSFVVPALAPLYAVNNYFYFYYPIALAHIATSVRFG
jgi:hypothetical protein